MVRPGELNIGLSYYQEREWICAIRKYGESIIDKSLLSKDQKEALIRLGKEKRRQGNGVQRQSGVSKLLSGEGQNKQRD